MTCIDSNYFSLLISVDVCFGSPVAELLGSHNTEEEVAKYRNHARVPWALYLQLDRSSFVFPFLSSLYPWLSTAGTLVALGRLLGLPIVCYDRCDLHEPYKLVFKSAER
jgi:hypothetical protein